jgi:hypothetical protein
MAYFIPDHNFNVTREASIARLLLHLVRYKNDSGKQKRGYGIAVTRASIFNACIIEK